MKLVLAAALCLLIGGCHTPTDAVIDTEKMVIYKANKADNGTHDYYITDKVSNWRFNTKEQFQVGDIVKVVKQ